MSGAVVLPVEAIRERLNTDPEFVLAARFWYGDVRFSVGQDVYFMRIENGQVARFHAGTEGFDPYDVHIGGSAEVWAQMLAEKPLPFYHDWFAASFHHDFEISGDLGTAYAYYYAIRRMHAVFGECVRERARAA